MSPGCRWVRGIFFREIMGFVAPAVGDTYAWTAGEYPFYRMIGLANEALLRIGDVPLVDTTTLDTAEDTTEYACAVAWKRRPYRVDVQSNDSSANNKWVEAEGWEYIPAVAGSTGLIVFPYEPEAGYGIRVHYIDRHPYVSTYSSVIREEIDPELAVLSLVAKALRWNCLRTGGSDKFKIQVWNQAEQEYLARSIMHPVPSYYAPRKGKLMIVRD